MFRKFTMYSVWFDYLMPWVPFVSVVILVAAVVGLAGLYYSADDI